MENSKGITALKNGLAQAVQDVSQGQYPSQAADQFLELFQKLVSGGNATNLMESYQGTEPLPSLQSAPLKDRPEISEEENRSENVKDDSSEEAVSGSTSSGSHDLAKDSEKVAAEVVKAKTPLQEEGNHSEDSHDGNNEGKPETMANPANEAVKQVVGEGAKEVVSKSTKDVVGSMVAQLGQPLEGTSEMQLQPQTNGTASGGSENLIGSKDVTGSQNRGQFGKEGNSGQVMAPVVKIEGTVGAVKQGDSSEQLAPLANLLPGAAVPGVIEKAGSDLGLERFARQAVGLGAVLGLDGAAGKGRAGDGSDGQFKMLNFGNFGLEAEMKKAGGAKDQAAGAKKLSESVQAKIVARIQAALDDAAKNRDSNTMVVRLDPPELGAMTVKVSYRSDQLFARIIPESQDVEAVIRSRVSELSQILANSGLKVENVHISIGQERSESETFKFSESFNRSDNRGLGGEAGANDMPGDAEKNLLDRTYSDDTLESYGWVA